MVRETLWSGFWDLLRMQSCWGHPAILPGSQFNVWPWVLVVHGRLHRVWGGAPARREGSPLSHSDLRGKREGRANPRHPSLHLVLGLDRAQGQLRCFTPRENFWSTHQSNSIVTGGTWLYLAQVTLWLPLPLPNSPRERHCSTQGAEAGSESEWLGLESWPYLLLSVWHWASYLTSLSPCFLLCRVGVIRSTL